MPNFNRGNRSRKTEDIDVATKIMETVQRQMNIYQNALKILQDMRHDIAEGKLQEGSASTPGELARIFEEKGMSPALAKAMAAEDFQDAKFQYEAAFWTWDCCCTACCQTCVMASQVTGCTETFVQ